MVRSPNLIRRPRGVFVTRLMNSDGGNYSIWRRAVSNRVRGGGKLSRQIAERERDGGASVEEEGEREWMKGIELSRKFHEKVWVGC